MHREGSVRDNRGRVTAAIAVCVLHFSFALVFLSPSLVGSLAYQRPNAHSFHPERSDEPSLIVVLLPPAPSKAPPHDSWVTDVVSLKHAGIEIPDLALPAIDNIEATALPARA